jgi:PDZ domain-containing secreted protein
LFDNYNPDETVKEVQTKEEVKEQHDLVNHLSQSKAFTIALDYVNKNCEKKFTKEEFKDQVFFFSKLTIDFKTLVYLLHMGKNERFVCF